MRCECEGVDIEVEPQLVNHGKRRPRRQAAGSAERNRERRVQTMLEPEELS